MRRAVIGGSLAYWSYRPPWPAIRSLGWANCTPVHLFVKRLFVAWRSGETGSWGVEICFMQSLLRCRKNDVRKSSAAARTSQVTFLIQQEMLETAWKSARPEASRLPTSDPLQLRPTNDLGLVKYSSVARRLVAPERSVFCELANPAHRDAENLGGVACADQLAVGGECHDHTPMLSQALEESNCPIRPTTSTRKSGPAICLGWSGLRESKCRARFSVEARGVQMFTSWHGCW